MAGDLTGTLRSLVRALFRTNRPTTDGIGRMSSVLYYLRSESEQPPFYDASREADDHAGRFPDRSSAKRTGSNPMRRSEIAIQYQSLRNNELTKHSSVPLGFIL